MLSENRDRGDRRTREQGYPNPMSILESDVILSDRSPRDGRRESKDLYLFLFRVGSEDGDGCPTLAAPLFLRLGWERTIHGAMLETLEAR